MADSTRPSDLMLAGKLRIRVKPGSVVLRMAVAPTHVTRGCLTLEIPQRYRDQPIEGLVVAVGAGKPFAPRYCKGLDGRAYEACGQRATAVAREMRDPEAAAGGPRTLGAIIEANLPREPRRFVCADCASLAHRAGGILIGPLLTHRPLEVAVGDRVITTPYAKRSNTTTILGEDLVVTDDLLAVLAPDAGLAVRGGALA